METGVSICPCSLCRWMQLNSVPCVCWPTLPCGVVESGSPGPVVNHWNPTWLPRSLHSLTDTLCIWSDAPIHVSFGQFSYLKSCSHTLFRVSLGFFSPHRVICLLINSVSSVWFLDCFTCCLSAVTVLHPCKDLSTYYSSHDRRRVTFVTPVLDCPRRPMTVRHHQHIVWHSQLLRTSTTSRSVSPPEPWRTQSGSHPTGLHGYRNRDLPEQVSERKTENSVFDFGCCDLLPLE